MIIIATSADRSIWFYRITVTVMWALLLMLTPLSAAAQKESDSNLEEVNLVMFLNAKTTDVLVVAIEPWESAEEVAFAMKIYENDALLEDFLNADLGDLEEGEGYQVSESASLSEDDAMNFGVESGLEFDVTLDGDPAVIYIMPVDLDVVTVMYLGEEMSERQLHRFIRNAVEEGVDVRAPRDFHRIDDVEELLD